jgi:hypothetical protein
MEGPEGIGRGIATQHLAEHDGEPNNERYGDQPDQVGDQQR